ncbi:hypothetical protein PPROV_000541400 [Pycnococcus provasolii]|uniref:RRM domain-containing protein n=1 Tax=Pycnococcus provasolii TaxID=41880 RepID=A0A830HNI4_9CHLO|nr:hypothetical protein PPROV_000541400 [Pycnococcus provasolii]
MPTPHPLAVAAGQMTSKTLYVTQLPPETTDEQLMAIAQPMVGVVRARVSRTGAQVRKSSVAYTYGFLEFDSSEQAAAALFAFNDAPIAGDLEGRRLKLNWAAGGGIGVSAASIAVATGNAQPVAKPAAAAGDAYGGANEHAIFVGDLTGEVTESELLGEFKQRYASVCGARIAVDPATGRGRGFGFVRFLDPAECQRSLSEMQGHFIGSRPIRVAEATRKSVDDNAAAIARAQALTAAHRQHTLMTVGYDANGQPTTEEGAEVPVEDEPDWDPLAPLNVDEINDVRVQWWRPMFVA